MTPLEKVIAGVFVFGGMVAFVTAAAWLLGSAGVQP